MNNDNGALTHIGDISDFDDVVNDPTKGYGILVENMLNRSGNAK